MKTTLKAGEILALISAGAHAVSARTLDTKSRFRIFSFKDALVRAAEDLEKKDREIAALTASASENEGEGAKVPFFLPRKHSVKNYYTDSDSLVCPTHSEKRTATRRRSGRYA